MASLAAAGNGIPTPRQRHDHNELQLPYRMDPTTGCVAFSLPWNSMVSTICRYTADRLTKR
jgi:hypothetical protein